MAVERNMRAGLETLSELVTGNEIALLELILCLHDSGALNKDEMADRLVKTSERVTPIFEDEGRDAQAITHPMRRIAAALRESIPLDEQGNQ